MIPSKHEGIMKWIDSLFSIRKEFGRINRLYKIIKFVSFSIDNAIVYVRM